MEITSRYPRVHGSPIHLSNPADIGIVDINKPDFGDSVTIGEIALNEYAVDWTINNKLLACILYIYRSIG